MMREPYTIPGEEVECGDQIRLYSNQEEDSRPFRTVEDIEEQRWVRVLSLGGPAFKSALGRNRIRVRRYGQWIECIPYEP